jgi:hypothetical protein
MEVALRRRLAGVIDVAISQSQQTAVVTFAPGTRHFSAAAFRSAIAEASVDVVSLEIDVCGFIRDRALTWDRHGQELEQFHRARANASGAV